MFEDTKYNSERNLRLTGKYTVGDLKKAYRRVTKLNHPDIASFHGVSTAQAEENMKHINEAYKFIQQIFDTFPYPEFIESDYYTEDDADDEGFAFALYSDEVFSGAYVEFGRYLIDSRNAFTPLTWYVLKVEDDTALLVTEQCIDCRPYSAAETAVWVDSDIRKWLNTVFLDRAFSDQEKESITKLSLENANHNKYGVFGGRDTLDSVFLLDSVQVKVFFANQYDLSADITTFALSRGSVEGRNGCGYWWLRNPGRLPSTISYVDNTGYIHDYDGRSCDAFGMSVRPAIIVKLCKRIHDNEKLERLRWERAEASKWAAEAQEQEVQRQKERNAAQCRQSQYARKIEEEQARSAGKPVLKTKPKIGQIVDLGKYPFGGQGVSLSWRVLDVQQNRTLLISEECVDYRVMGNDVTTKTWDVSLLRKWLNSEFYKRTFSAAERVSLLITDTTESDRVSSDKIFCLSTTEAKKYFFSNSDRQAKPAAWLGSKNDCHIDECCSWWLRSESSQGDDFITVVYSTGVILDVGVLSSQLGIGVRPAMWIKTI